VRQWLAGSGKPERSGEGVWGLALASFFVNTPGTPALMTIAAGWTGISALHLWRKRKAAKKR